MQISHSYSLVTTSDTSCSVFNRFIGSMMYSPSVKWVLNAEQNVLKQSVLSMIRVCESALDEQVIWCAGEGDLHYGGM